MAQYQTTQTVDARIMGGMFAWVVLPTAAGTAVVAAGTQATAFLDRIGQSIASGFPAPAVVTRADANQFGGEIPQGERAVAWGCAVQVLETNAGGISAAAGAGNALATASALFSISMQLDIRGQSYAMGSVLPLPCGHGSDGLAQNGGNGANYFRFPDSLPLDLGPQDRFSIRYQAERPITIQNVNGALAIYTYLPTLRGVDLANLAGA
jgi:hypothetical protein